MSMDYFSDRWDDYQLLGKQRNTGPSIPTYAIRANNVPMFRYDSVAHELSVSMQMPHGWNGLTIKPHIHWESRTSATYTGTWAMDYIWANPTPGSLVITTGFVDGSFNLSAVFGEMQLTNMTDITLVSPIPSALLQARLYLSSFTAGTGLWLWGWDFHYQKNRPGTITPTTNP